MFQPQGSVVIEEQDRTDVHKVGYTIKIGTQPKIYLTGTQLGVLIALGCKQTGITLNR